MMQKIRTTIEPFQVIGIKVRTTNEQNQATKDIPQLWDKFMSENSINKIPNKIDYSILCIYTNYEGDYTQPYDAIIGCRVSNLEGIPEGMIGISFDGGLYNKTSAKGDLQDNIVFNHWLKIWESDWNRAYTVDFEVYGEKSQNPMDAEIDIYIAIK